MQEPIKACQKVRAISEQQRLQEDARRQRATSFSNLTNPGGISKGWDILDQLLATRRVFEDWMDDS